MDAGPQQVLEQVAALLQRRRTTQARALLKPALANHPEHTGLLLQAAYVDYLEDQPEQALQSVTQVLKAEPDHPSARELYFTLLADKEQYVEAEHVIIELLRDYPEAADYYGRYADLMLRTLNLGKALRLAREGLKYDADDPECLAAQAVCEFIEQPAGQPSRGLQQLLVRHPQSLRTLVLVVIALQQRGELREARRVAQELVRAQPDNEHLIQIASSLSVSSHWSMLPLWPMQKWGWAASFGLWLLAIIGIRAISKVNEAAGGAFGIIVLIYVIYSWVWPPILRRLLRA
jgi:tetratricopeptide (TPR) repeat protein